MRCSTLTDPSHPTGTMNVTVLDRPGAPEGPLEYDDVTANSVSLSWKAPSDDGGSPIT